METSDLLHVLVDVLDRMGLRYSVTGSMASTHYGIVRYTNDVDVVVELPLGRVSEFCRAFPADRDYYVSEDAARDAAARHSQFNILHATSGLKIDVML